MQWVPKAVTERLDVQVKALRDNGYSAFRKDVLGLLVVYRTPASGEQLWPVLEDYMLLTAPALSSRRNAKALMVTLPSPVSLRIDALVDGVRDLGYAVFRHELVGALSLKRQPKTRDELVALYIRYREARVEDIARPDIPIQRLLTTQRPEQGRRRLVR